MASALALALLATSPLSAQPSPGLAFTGPTLERSHWAVEAVERAVALRLLDAHLPAQRAMPLEVVERALREAAERAPERAPAVSELSAAWHARLLEEFSGVEAARKAAPAGGVLRAGVAAGFGMREGAAAPGLGEFEPHRTGALPLDDRTGPLGAVDVSLGFGEHLAMRIRPILHHDGTRVETAELVAGWRRAYAAVGRIPVGYGHGFGGAVTLTGDVGLDAVQLGTRAPFRMPWVLRHLGDVSLHTFLGRMDEGRHVGDPFSWGGSGHLQPHPRFTLGVHRAALFGGDHPEPHPVTPRSILNMLIGRVVGVGFEDQIVSVSGRWVLPTEAVLPLTAYLEWGAEDAAGAWAAVPGRSGGIWAPSLPGLPQAGGGIEVSHFGTSCCGNPSWYRHWSFHGSWASRTQTLGHPLGGDGREVMVHAAADLAEARLRVGGRAFHRLRRDENLYSPGRTGKSNGAAAHLEYRVTPRTELRLEGAHEDGEGWAETNVRLKGGIFF